MNGDKLAPIAVVPAGGEGARYGGRKQFVRLCGHSLLEWSLKAVVDGGDCRLAVVALNGDEAPDEAFVGCPVRLCPGGDSRAESVRSALGALADEPEDSWLLVHDAVRPLLPPADVRELVRRVRQRAGATGRAGGILVEKIAAAVKRGECELLAENLHPGSLWLAQTPQMFRLGVLRRAMERAEDLSAVEDEARLVSSFSDQQVLLVEGSPINRKITWPADLQWARALLASAGRH